MRSEAPEFETRPFLKIRRAYRDILAAGRRKNMIHGLGEGDVTDARRLIHDREAAGRTCRSPLPSSMQSPTPWMPTGSCTPTGSATGWSSSATSTSAISAIRGRPLRRRQWPPQTL